MVDFRAYRLVVAQRRGRLNEAIEASQHSCDRLRAETRKALDRAATRENVYTEAQVFGSRDPRLRTRDQYDRALL